MDAITVIPAIKKLSFNRVGPWRDLRMEFGRGLNIITEEGSAWGKTAIFEGLIRSLVHSWGASHLLSPAKGEGRGRISVQLQDASRSIELPTFDHAPEKPDQDESRGEFELRRLSHHLDRATPDMAVLVEDEVTACLDSIHRSHAFRVMLCARCQVICQISHGVDPRAFPDARIFTCHLDEGERTGMKLLQVG